MHEQGWLMHRGINQRSEQSSVAGLGCALLQPGGLFSPPYSKTPIPCLAEVLSNATIVGFYNNYSRAEAASLFLGPVGQQIRVLAWKTHDYTGRSWTDAAQRGRTRVTTNERHVQRPFQETSHPDKRTHLLLSLRGRRAVLMFPFL